MGSCCCFSEKGLAWGGEENDDCWFAFPSSSNVSGPSSTAMPMARTMARENLYHSFNFWDGRGSVQVPHRCGLLTWALAASLPCLGGRRSVMVPGSPRFVVLYACVGVRFQRRMVSSLLAFLSRAEVEVSLPSQEKCSFGLRVLEAFVMHLPLRLSASPLQLQAEFRNLSSCWCLS